MRNYYSVTEPQGLIDPVSGFQLFDDFVVDTLNGDPWAVAVESDGTGQTTVAIEASQHGGNLKFTVGATANDFGVIASPLDFHTASGRSMDLLVSVRADNLDSWAIGFSDAVSETNGVLVSNATVASGALVPSDFLGFVAESANGSGYIMPAYAKGGTDVVVQPSKNVSLAASTADYTVLRVRLLEDGRARWYVNGELLADKRIDGLTASIPMCVILSTSDVAGTASMVMEVDYVSVYMDR